jgi:RNA polymerase sigma factor (sigma-70 family)
MAPGQLDRMVRHVRGLVGERGPAPSDRQLLDRFAHQGEQAAFAELVARHGPMVLAVCRRVTGDEHEAEDAFQATFLVLAQKAGGAGWSESVAGWLHSVAHRVALKARGRAARRRKHEGLAAMRAQVPVDPPDEELLALVQAEVARLPEKYRAALVLCHLEGKTNAEAARALGCPLGSMSTRLARARDLLRRRLAGRGAPVCAGALAGLLGPPGGAAVPESLRLATLQAAALVAAGHAAAGAGVAALAEGVLYEMSREKLKTGLFLALTVGVLSTGTGLLGYRVVAADVRTAAAGVRSAATAFAPAPAPAGRAARTFSSDLPLLVFQLPRGEGPRLLGTTGGFGARPIKVPAGATWWVQPITAPALGGSLGGLGGGLGIGGGALGMGGGAFGLGGGVMPPGGGALGGLGGGALGVGGGALGALGGPGMGGGIAGVLVGPGMGGGLARPALAFGPRLTGDSLKALVAQFKKQKVPGLAVCHLQISEADVALLAGLDGLRTLIFQGPSLDDRGVARLKGCKGLRFLALEGTDVRPEALEALAGLKTLARLHLAGPKVTNKALEGIKGARGLTWLRLSHTAVDHRGLAALEPLPNLTTLELCGPFTDADLAALADLTGLKRLRLHQTAITDKGLEVLKGLKDLEAVSIDAHWTPDGIEPGSLGRGDPGAAKPRWRLPRQSATPGGAPVNVPAPRFTAKGLAVLASLPELVEVNLSSDRLRDDDLAFLAKMTGLRRLGLFAPEVTDRGATRLRALVKLETIDLRGTQVTTATAAALRGLPMLRLVKTNVAPGDPKSKASLAGWKKFLPRATVTPMIDAPTD